MPRRKPQPRCGRQAASDAMQMAIAIIDYVMDVWRSMDSGESLSLSYAEDRLLPAVRAWKEFAANRGGKVSKRDLQQAKVGGVRTAEHFGRVLDEHEKHYSGCVITERPERGGKEHVWIVTPEYSQKKSGKTPRKVRRQGDGVVTHNRQTDDVDARKAAEKPGKRIVKRRHQDQPSTSGLRLGDTPSTPAKYFPPGSDLRRWTADNF